MIRRLALAAAVLLAVAVTGRAQNVAPPPNFTFVAGGSAIGYTPVSGGGGSQAGSVAYMGVQLMPSISVTYEHITVPSISARFELGTVNYTRALSSILGATLTKKLSFDASNFNVTFKGGAGKALFPSGNHMVVRRGHST